MSILSDAPDKLVRKMVVAFLPSEYVLRTRLSNGAIVKGKNKAGYGGRGVFVYRDEIEREFEHIDRFVEPGALFIDIGANTGIYTMKVAKHLAGSGAVIAVEPFTETAGRLASTVAANRFSNVRVRNFAVSDSFGPTDFWLNNDQPNSFSLKRYNATRKVSVLQVTLDQICDWEQIDRLDYVKIDAGRGRKKNNCWRLSINSKIFAHHPGRRRIHRVSAALDILNARRTAVTMLYIFTIKIRRLKRQED